MARLWALRLLVVAGGYEGLIDDLGRFSDPSVARWLSLAEDAPPRWYGDRFHHDEAPPTATANRQDTPGQQFPPASAEPAPLSLPASTPRQQALRRLHDRYLHAEHNAPAAAGVPALHHAARLASRMGGLTPAEITLLAFLALLEHPGLPLRRTAACLPTDNLATARLAFSATLGIPASTAAHALAPHGTLIATGLICLDVQGTDLAGIARLADPTLARQLIPLRPASWQAASDADANGRRD